MWTGDRKIDSYLGGGGMCFRAAVFVRVPLMCFDSL